MKLLIAWICGLEAVLLLILLIAIDGCADKLSIINHSINQHPYDAMNYNCKNYVDDKYKELLKADYKDEDMSFAVTSYKGEPHVVLNVNGWILDNLKDSPYMASKDLKNGLTYHYWKYFREHQNG